MGYPKDLDEYTWEELQNELNRRAVAYVRGLCDYCGHPGNDPPCKFLDRHARAIQPAPPPPVRYAVVDTDNFGRDYPDEKFVEGTDRGITHEEAIIMCRQYNVGNGNQPRWYKVVALPYVLQPGFEP